MGLKSLAQIDIASKLIANPFFREFPMELVEELGPMVRFEYIPKNSVILEQGKSNTYLYILNRGRVGVIVDGEKVAEMDRSGDLIGEMSVIANKPCSATIVAETSVEIITVLAGDFVKAEVGEDHRGHGALYRTFAMILTDKLSKTNEKARRFETTNRDLKLTQKKLRQMNLDLERLVEVRTEELAESNTAMQQLLDNLDQGFLMINKEMIAEPIYTTAAKKFFGQDLQGKTLPELFSLVGSEAQNMEAWAELGFSNQLPFESVSEMGMNHLERDGHHIALEYRPVYVGENKDLEKIIVVATDISHEVALKEQAKAEQDLVQLAISVMRDRSSFVDYVFEIRRIFALVVSELEKPPIAIDLPNLFRWIHTIKGGLSSYHMNKMARRAHLLEDLLGGCRDSNQGISQGLREESLVSVQDLRQSFEAFIVENEKILGRLDSNQGRQRTFNGHEILSFAEYLKKQPHSFDLYQNFVYQFLLEDIANGFHQFEDLVIGIASRQSKIASLHVHPSDFRVYLPNYKALIGSFVHLFRNAVDHGIELPDERRLSDKSEVGSIDVRFQTFENEKKKWMRIEIQDDGRGLNIDKIRQKCVERKLLTQINVERMNDIEVMQYVFSPGFSTRDTVTEDSGRGVGLDAIKAEAEQLGGHVFVDSRAGLGSRFVIEVPLFVSLSDTQVNS